MKTTVTLEPEKASERETRDSIDRAAKTARDMARARGRGDVSQEQMRKQMQQHAETEHRKRQEKGE